MILASEINRTPPKTPARCWRRCRAPLPPRRADLSAARSRSSCWRHRTLSSRSTIPSPAQLDRSCSTLSVGYPSRAEELAIRQRTTSTLRPELEPFARLDPAILNFFARLVRQVVRGGPRVCVWRWTSCGQTAGRKEPDARSSFRHCLRWGPGPRAASNLILGGKARGDPDARGRLHVTTEDIREVAHPRSGTGW